MIRIGELLCPICGGALKYVGPVKRMVRTEYGKKEWIKIRRMKCMKCGVVHRELPDNLIPFKQYDAEIIEGVINGDITSEVIEYEDFPSEMTMKRWLRSQK